MVRKERLELSRLAALEPKSSAYTNFATSAVRDTPQALRLHSKSYNNFHLSH